MKKTRNTDDLTGANPKREKATGKGKKTNPQKGRGQKVEYIPQAEVPTISIMKITGHRTEKAFMKYIKITQEQNANKLGNHPYFIKSPLKVVNQ